MLDPDIAIRLRESDGGYFMRKMFTEAADEIERLRTVVEAWLKYSQRAERDIETLRAERDEARRMACEKEETLGCDERGVPRNGSARDHAKQRGWDCFKEAP